MVVLLVGSLFSPNVVYAQDLWNTLKQEGETLDLMAIESLGGSVLLVAAKYEQLQWQSSDNPDPTQLKPQSFRKQLHILSINSEEKINWQHSYPALPDVNEVFSISPTSGNQLCIAYGRHYRGNEFINPVVLEVTLEGKIVWANKHVVPAAKFESSEKVLVQMANLDSIKMVGSADDGCVLAFVLRLQAAEGETFQINLLKLDGKGDLQWHFSKDTALYGKMLLVRDTQQNHYTIIQTNQSRDAAIDAMMAGRPFTPHTSMTIVSKEGKLISSHENLPALSKVWVKHMVDAPGDSVLLAGNAKTAWAGFVNSQGKVRGINNSLEGEFSLVKHLFKQGYLLVLDESLVTMGSELNPQFHQPISRIIKKKYSSNYLEAKFPDQIPVQNIVPLKSNSYLMLYKLGSKLMKIDISD